MHLLLYSHLPAGGSTLGPAGLKACAERPRAQPLVLVIVVAQHRDSALPIAVWRKYILASVPALSPAGTPLPGSLAPQLPASPRSSAPTAPRLGICQSLPSPPAAQPCAALQSWGSPSPRLLHLWAKPWPGCGERRPRAASRVCLSSQPPPRSCSWVRCLRGLSDPACSPLLSSTRSRKHRALQSAAALKTESSTLRLSALNK